MLKIGVTGGIGSGKTTLCRMFAELGAPIYNSDARAKMLMINDLKLRESIIESFGSQSYCGDELNRGYLSQCAFSSAEGLAKLNSLVHPRVKSDFQEWCEKQNSPYVILECAILFEAKFNEYVDYSVVVLSPKPMRVERVISRDGLTVEQVEARMAHQLSDQELNQLSDLSVVNFDIEDLEDAAKLFDKRFRYEAQQN